MRKSRYIIYLMLVGAVLCMVGRKPSAYDRAAALRKAEALYAQAVVHEALDSDIYAYRLLDYAASIAPGDSALRYDRDRERLFGISRGYVYEELIDTLIGQWLNNPGAADQAKSYGYVTMSLHDFDRSIRILEGYEKKYSDDWNVLENLIDAYNHSFIISNDTANVYKALALCERARQQLGTNTEIISQKVRTLMLLDDTTAVDSALELLCRENPDDAVAHYYAAEIYSRRGNDIKALNLIKKAYDIDPDEAEITLGLALGYRNIGDSLQYMTILSDWLTNANFDRETRLEAFAEFLSDELDSITDANTQWVDSITGLLIKEADDVRINEIKAIFQTQTLRLDDALTTFKHTSELDPSNYKNRMQVIIMQILTGDSIAALQTCNQALSNIRNYPDAIFSKTHANMASFAIDEALKRNDTSQALAIADSVMATTTDTLPSQNRFNILLSIAEAFSAKDHHDDAIPWYARAYAIEREADDSRRYELYNDYAYSLAIADTMLDLALDLSRYATLYDAHNPNNLDTYAWVYFKRGEYAEAQKQINYAIDAAIDARKNTYGYRHDAEAGIITKEEIEKDENTLFLTDDEKAELRAHNIEQAIKYSPDLWETLYDHAGDIAFFNKDINTAVDYWTRSLDINPDNELVARKVKNRTYFFE